MPNSSDLDNSIRQLHQKTLGSPEICVAVLDGIVDQDHDCFQGASLTRLPSLVQEDVSVNGLMSAHGTHVASVIFGQPGSSVAGIAPRCKGLLVSVFSDERRGASQLDLARGIEQAVNAGAHIINISGGELTDIGEAEGWLENAVRLCQQENVLLIAAAGNDGCECLHVPAALPAVLAVGAMDGQGRPMGFSNWGPAYQSQGILAPGADIVGAKPGGGTRKISGTSFATPIVTGVAALLLSLQRERGDPIDSLRVREVLLQSALPCKVDELAGEQQCLAGQLNISGAITLLTGGPMSDELIINPSACSCGGGMTRNEELTEELTQSVTKRRTVPSQATPQDVLASASLPQRVAAQSVPMQTEAQPMSIQAVSAQPMSAQSMPMPSMSTQMVSAQSMPTQGVSVQPMSMPSMPSQAASSQAAGFAQVPSESSHPNPMAAAVVPSQFASEPGMPGQGVPSQVMPSQVQAAQVAPIGVVGLQRVYALGTLGYDFATEARRDTFKQLMPPFDLGGAMVPANPYDARQMVDYLASDISEAKSLIWTLNIELTPVYAIEPKGPFAREAYLALQELLAGQILSETDEGYIERVSIPGIISGRTVRLFSGQVVPVIEPQSTRGLYGWKINRLVNEAMSSVQESEGGANEESMRRTLGSFLNRVYYDLRNLGLTSQERALNFSVTNAFQAASTFSQAVAEGMELDSIAVERSPFCRMDSDCWDVKLKFFDPENNRRAKKIFRFTIDVSDLIPVTLGEVKSWSSPY